ncbi:hypothetical protein GWI33_000191 [Rhynchophorus ferrugineus]|uniref:Uncharacterized protein n=1 Tax=Rhynchophorus ferrugineus TaxID=354439 RepID=A0A834IY08_RHYFE|nr:hypothetical protein GWI33_000191 [Rhynchophorus ferrugineus]
MPAKQKQDQIQPVPNENVVDRGPKDPGRARCHGTRGPGRTFFKRRWLDEEGDGSYVGGRFRKRKGIKQVIQLTVPVVADHL